MKNILFTILTICLVWACYDDKSTLPTVEYPTISVNRSGESQYLTVSYGEEFIYEPRLYWLDGKDTIYLSEDTYDDYDYEWDLSVLSTGTDTMKQIISRERILKAVINSTPTTSGYSYYTLTLHVTHRASGVVKNLIWEMKVLSVYGGGLLVAETSDETNSDISLIMSRTFNTNLVDYDADTVHYKIFSKHNGTPINGLVNSFTYVNGSAFSGITALVPGESIIRIDPVTMEEQDRNMDLFFYEPEVYNPQAVFAAYSTNVLINNGKVQTYAASTANKYSVDSDSPYDVSAVYAGDKMDWVTALLFDQKEEKFITLSTGTFELDDIQTILSGKFDPREMTGCKPIYAESVNSTLTKWLIKKDGGYYIYEVDCNVDYDDDDWPRVFQGKNIYDLEYCPNIDQATAFAFSANNEFFYAVDNVLYVVPLTGVQPVPQVSYDKLLGNEKITHIKIYRGSGYTAWSDEVDEDTGELVPFWRNAKNNVICIVTYDGSEGRVYTLPIQYAGTGGIASDKYVRCYEGFGRITGIGTRE